MTPAVKSRLDALNRYVARVTAPSVDPELAGYLFRFGAVLVCGALEQCVQLIVLDRLQQRAHPRVINFIKAYFRRGVNYDCKAITQLLMRFDTTWGKGFEAEISKKPALSAGVSSCYAIRNSVAHGGNDNVSGARLREFAQVCFDVIELVEQCTR